MSDRATDNPPVKEPVTWSILNSMKVRVSITFTLLFVLSLLTIQLIEHYGIPFTPYAGWVSREKVTAFNSLSFTADLKKEHLENNLTEFRNDTLMFSRNFLLRESVYTLGKDLLAIQEQIRGTSSALKELRTKKSFYNIKQYLERIKSTYMVYSRVDVLDVDTSMIMVSTDSTREGTVLVDYPTSLITGIEPQNPSITMWKQRQTDKATLAVAYPIIELGKERFELNTLLIIYINTGTILNPMLHTGDGLGETGEALLINHNQVILAPLKHPLVDGTMAKPFEYKIIAEPARRAAGGEEGIINSNDYRGVPVLAAYRYIPISAEMGWGMVIKRDESEIYRSLRQSEFHLLLIGVIFILITTFIATLLADTLTRPLYKLSRTAQLVELGNLDIRAEETGTEETRTLAKALNSMLDRYQDWNEELEILVEKRTGQLKDKNQELEQIVYVTSHDLRSPLVNIQGFSRELALLFSRINELSGKESLTIEEHEELSDILGKEAPESLDFIQTSVGKMDTLLKGLLHLSRLGRASLEIGMIDMNSLIKEVSENFKYRIQESNVSLIVEDLLPAMGDNNQINQVFSNLVDNALKYLDQDRDGTIRITSKQDGDMIVYCVSDNGIGFSSDLTNKVFEIFHRLNPAKSSGDGLGLTIARKLVEKHEGKIWAESTPGEGSAFFVSLPPI